MYYQKKHNIISNGTFDKLEWIVIIANYNYMISFFVIFGYARLLVRVSIVISCRSLSNEGHFLYLHSYYFILDMVQG